ncbi:MAG: hypothetical protein JSS20_16275 [Proteobacteria bacterium]|nr:hypothetical protein [Pseudomonadota bacterium]
MYGGILSLLGKKSAHGIGLPSEVLATWFLSLFAVYPVASLIALVWITRIAMGRLRDAGLPLLFGFLPLLLLGSKFYQLIVLPNALVELLFEGRVYDLGLMDLPVLVLAACALVFLCFVPGLERDSSEIDEYPDNHREPQPKPRSVSLSIPAPPVHQPRDGSPSSKATFGRRR